VIYKEAVPNHLLQLTGALVRPALVVSPGQIGQDIVLVAISSVLRDGLVPTIS